MRLKELNCKALLCDTCVLIELVRLPKTTLTVFLQEIVASEAVLQVEDVIMYELLRGSKNYQQAQETVDLITALLGTSLDKMNYLPTTSKDVIEAQIISNINNNIDPNYSSRASLADHLLIAKLSRISKSAGLFLATFNHQDFIPPLMNRVAIINIETPKRVLPLGIYQFDLKCYQVLKNKFGFS